MESKYFSLEVNKSNKLTRIFQLVFGIVCAIVALVWLILNISTLKSNRTMWITIIFLFGFAYFQVISGLGRAEKYIEISQFSIKLKRNSLFPSHELKASEIEKIEMFPLNMIFFLRSGKTVILRFGTTFTDIIEPIKKEIDSFCRLNNIGLEIRTEEF